jgi:hypothetical protein
MNGTQVACPDDPRYIRDERMCLFAISKDAKGALRLEDAEVEECEQRKCKTLKTVHLLELKLTAHRPCDAREARTLSGSLVSRDLTSAFVNGDGKLRGFHGGTFRWQGASLLATGTLSGVTNAGTHRKPFDPACQECNAPGFMEGRFCGVIRRAPDRTLVGCNLIGIYKLRVADPSSKGGEGPLQGVIEGVVVCPCG